MNRIKIFCFGFGQVAKGFLQKISKEKVQFDFSGTSTKPSNDIRHNDFNIKLYQFNNDSFDTDLISKLEEAKFILISIPPINGEDIVIKKFKNVLKKANKCNWITYLSATSVYGNHNGAWVNENSNTNPTSKNGIHRLNAENSWKEFSEKNNLPLQIFRLAGIYSNEFNILKRLLHGNVQIVDKKNHFFSRIHVEDIANILFESMKKFNNRETYNICDDKPASQNEVAAYGAKLLELEKPKPVKLDEIESEMLKNFYKDSKKVDNKKMKSFFNYKLKYPTYEEGLNYIFNNIV
tara:strand:- start:204 stop:1082 length:879 start_codon:yes stop_codon:yes gene_type:complete